jgi:hypothetical protein
MKKTSLIHVRVTDAERERIDSLANAEGRSTAGYIRHRLFDPDLPQMEHLATDPAHRPVPEPLVVRAAVDSVGKAGMDATARTIITGRSDIERQRAAQSSRDEILRGINKKK